MELALSVLWSIQLLALIGRGALSARGTARLELTLGVISLGHNDNIIQIKYKSAKI